MTSGIPQIPNTTRAVRFDHFGSVDVLSVVDVPTQRPGPGEVLVQVKAVGINPGEVAIRRGLFGEAQFPSGQGSDLTGIVLETGSGAGDFEPGDEVLGFSWSRSSQATTGSVPQRQLVAKPAALSWPVAGALYMPAVTGWAAVDAVDPKEGETVVVSGAAGGVGRMVVQLLELRGVKVVAIAANENREWLQAHGAVQVPYRGDDLAGRVRVAAPDGIDALIDLHGPDYLDLALELGVPTDRIETVIAFARAQEIGAKHLGSGEYSNREVLTAVAVLVAEGKIDIDIVATYPLDEVRAAYTRLEQGHTGGRIVLLPGEPS